MSWLQPTPENEQDIQQLRGEQPELYAYAQVLALALRIDSRLLRNLRLCFFPKSSVELETELWFSSLIHTRNVQAATMYSGIARALCDALKNENLDRFASAKAEIGKLTQHWPETDRIEQEMRWAVLESDEQALKKNVQRILKTLTLVEGDVEKRELARWVKGTLPILNGTKQAGTGQQWLSQYVVASLGLLGKWWEEDVELQPLPTILVNALPKAKQQQIGLRLHSGTLEVLKPEEAVEVVEISMLLPTTVLLEFEIERTESTLLSMRTNKIKKHSLFWIGKKIEIPQKIYNITLRMIDGTLIKVIRTESEKPIKVFISYHLKDQKWKDRLEHHLSKMEFDTGKKLSIWNYSFVNRDINWHFETEKAINESDVAILLVSANYLASDFSYNIEMPILQKRLEQKQAQTIPVIINHCDWISVKWLSNLQCLPKNNKVITEMSFHEQEKTLSDLAKLIGDTAKQSPELHDHVNSRKASLFYSDFLPNISNMDITWQIALADEFTQPYWQTLNDFLAQEVSAGKTILPPEAMRFNALQSTALDKVKVVILGQDPYPTVGHAHGLAFSVLPDVKPLPRSLQNINKELLDDVGVDNRQTGCLQPWADQGVLLLNTVLSVAAGQAGSHQKQGWEHFTDAVIQAVNQQAQPVVFVLWGAHAQKKAALIDASRHLIIESVHPSPRSARRGFFGSKPFSRANMFLQVHGREGINWQLDDDVALYQ